MSATVDLVDPTVLGALIGAGPALIVGLGAWAAAHRGNRSSELESTREMFRYALTQVTEGSTPEARAAGWVILEELAKETLLPAAERRMMLGTVRKLRALRRGSS